MAPDKEAGACGPASHAPWAGARVDEYDDRPSHPVILVARETDFCGSQASPTSRPGEKADIVKRRTEFAADMEAPSG